MLPCIFLRKIIFHFQGARSYFREKEISSSPIIQERSYFSPIFLEKPSFQDVWKKKIWFSVQCNQVTIKNPIRCTSSLITVHRRYTNHRRCIRIKHHTFQLFIHVPNLLYSVNIFQPLASAASEPQHHMQTFNSLTRQLQTYPIDLCSPTYHICSYPNSLFLK